jgi:hypothetical protein
MRARLALKARWHRATDQFNGLLGGASQVALGTLGVQSALDLAGGAVKSSSTGSGGGSELLKLSRQTGRSIRGLAILQRGFRTDFKTCFEQGRASVPLASSEGRLPNPQAGRLALPKILK